MHALRRWSVRHAGTLEHFYRFFSSLMTACAPVFRKLGFARVERAVIPFERRLKGLMFDCSMCGVCLLSKNGMSCPMNCPKSVRNGPCGGEHGPAPLCGAPTTSSGSRLEQILASGCFAVTAEFSRPDSADPVEVYSRLDYFREEVDAINVTDGSGANCHMSSLGVSALLLRAGFEPVMQIACRDRNRIAIQGDILGAAALGIRNLLCFTGDSTPVGDHPDAMPVCDLDSMSLLQTARIMRESGVRAGRKPAPPASEHRASAVAL